MIDRMYRTMAQTVDVPTNASEVSATFEQPIVRGWATVQGGQVMFATVFWDGKTITASLNGLAPASTKVHFQCEY